MQRRSVWVLVSGFLVGSLAAIAMHVGYVLWSRNVHEVVPHVVYRTAQLSGPQLEHLVRAHGIRSVINLRGKCELETWYWDECRASRQTDVNQHDLCMSAGRLPATEEIRHLVRVLDRTDYPVVIHCRQGADRTGLAAALILLLHTDATPAEALEQLNVRYGHVRLGRTANIDFFFDLYAEWLAAREEGHSRPAFRHWLEHDYCPGMCKARIEPVQVPERVAAGRPWLARVRATNRSVRSWPFRSGTTAGVHLGYQISGPDGRVAVHGRAGLRNVDVAPGNFIDIDVPLPPLAVAGKYTVMFDLIDEQQCWFYQAGSPPLECDFTVVAPGPLRPRNQDQGTKPE